MCSTTYKKQGAPDRRSLTQQQLRFFTCVAPHTKKQGDPDLRSLTQQKLSLFTCVAPHIKSKGSRSAVPYSAKKSTFFTCVASRIKSKGAPDRCSTHLLLLSTRASSRTKSKELHRYALQIYYFINQVSKSFCSLAGIIINGLALP
jgi:hypothetical protein